jgi:hypothetical protein
MNCEPWLAAWVDGARDGELAAAPGYVVSRPRVLTMRLDASRSILEGSAYQTYFRRLCRPGNTFEGLASQIYFRRPSARRLYSPRQYYWKLCQLNILQRLCRSPAFSFLYRVYIREVRVPSKSPLASACVRRPAAVRPDLLVGAEGNFLQLLTALRDVQSMLMEAFHRHPESPRLPAVWWSFVASS